MTTYVIKGGWFPLLKEIRACLSMCSESYINKEYLGWLVEVSVRVMMKNNISKEEKILVSWECIEGRYYWVFAEALELACSKLGVKLCYTDEKENELPSGYRPPIDTHLPNHD